MNPAANPPEPGGQRTEDRGRKAGPGRRRLFAGGLLAALLAAAVLLAPGCNKSGGSKSHDERADEKKADPWDALAKRLRKETDVAGCKSALGQLAGELPNRPDVPAPGPLGPDAEKAIAEAVPLNPTDLQEVRQASYTTLDAVYLSECLYLADAARSLDAAGLPDARRAELAFAWVCREEYLSPWLVPAPRGGLMATLVPPVYVLRRGYGSGLERAYVFLALLQQLGIDGCLVGPPETADRPAGFVAPGPDGQPLTGAPKGPFWAVGARAGADVLLFEPWRGEPFPGTLASLKANPESLKRWLDDKSWGVTADDVRKATVYLAAPVSALAPRMELLEEKLKTDAPVRLAIHPGKLRDRFAAAPPAGPGLPSSDVKFWNPPNDPFAYGRVLPMFLPLEEGGADRGEPGSRLFDRYVRDQVPPAVFTLPPDVKLGEDLPRRRLMAMAITSYGRAFLEPPTPQEQFQRGQFQEALKGLVE